MNSNQLHIVGIVAEYNPFHNGHAWQLEKARAKFPNAYIVAVMSGNFVQRGQPALLDKWQRAKIAVECGIDLVLELPFSFACRSAEHFARGSIGILNATGVVNQLVFGAECPDIEQLKLIARRSLNPNTVAEIKAQMKIGLSYPQALQKALTDSELPVEELLSPNNILAIEYLKQLQLLNSRIQPNLILRHISGYKDTVISSPIASATAIRKQLPEGLSNLVANTLPEPSRRALETAVSSATTVLDNNANLSLLAIHCLRNSTAEYLRHYTDVSEGLEYSLIKNAAIYNTLPKLTDSLVNKRYTHSRISRIILQALVGMYKAEQADYIRPLAFNSRGRAVLSQIKTHATLPLITKLGRDFANLPTQLQDCLLLKTEINSGNLYQMLLANSSGVHNLDFLKSPYFIN